MPGNDRNKTTRIARLRALQAGLTKHYGAKDLVLLGTPYTPDELQAALQSDVDAIARSSSSYAAWLTAVKEERDSNAGTNPLLRAIEAQVKAQFGESQNAGSTLADFDLAPRAVTTLTSDQKAAKAVQARATRAARRTMGPRQRAKIVGTVPAGGGLGVGDDGAPTTKSRA